ALERKQGRTVGGERGEQALIIRHPDVRRMLMLMRANIAAMRGVLYRTALAIDLARHLDDEERRSEEEELAALLTPISKAWASDLGIELTSLGIQIHGGSGYIEETGAAQWWRDSRIAAIYEGTNGMMAQDLAMRRIPLGGGMAMRRLFEMVLGDAASLEGDLKPIADRLTAAAEAAAEVAMTFGQWLLEGRYDDVLAGATPFLKMMGDTLGGWMLARGARAAMTEPRGYDPAFLADRIALASFYAEHVLPTVMGRKASCLAGAEGVFAIDEARFI
ncbi:MAG TPA: acyl-CoA dehydrogenase, partial [Acidimicrobiia bacterium]